VLQGRLQDECRKKTSNEEMWEEIKQIKSIADEIKQDENKLIGSRIIEDNDVIDTNSLDGNSKTDYINFINMIYGGFMKKRICYTQYPWAKEEKEHSM